MSIPRCYFIPSSRRWYSNYICQRTSLFSQGALVFVIKSCQDNTPDLKPILKAVFCRHLLYVAIKNIWFFVIIHTLFIINAQSKNKQTNKQSKQTNKRTNERTNKQTKQNKTKQNIPTNKQHPKKQTNKHKQKQNPKTKTKQHNKKTKAKQSKTSTKTKTDIVLL